MSLCKQALEQWNGDVERATKALEAISNVKATKIAQQVATEGIIRATIDPYGQFGVMIELNCETDFVARSSGFVALADKVAQHVLLCKESCVSRDETFVDGSLTLAQVLLDFSFFVGEKIVLRRVVGFVVGGSGDEETSH